MYPSLTHSPPTSASHPSSVISRSFKDGKAKDAGDEYFENTPVDGDGKKTTSKEAVTIPAKIPESDGTNTTEHKNAALIYRGNALKNISVGDEEKVENGTNIMLSNSYSDTSESKSSSQYEEKTPNSRKQRELSEKEEALTENRPEKTAEIIVDKERIMHIKEKAENQEEKETEGGEEKGKEKENIVHKKYATKSIVENMENLNSYENDTNQEKQQESDTDKSISMEEEERKSDEHTIKKFFKRTRFKLDSTKDIGELDVGKKIRKNENLLNNEDDNTRRVSEAEVSKEKEEKEREKKLATEDEHEAELHHKKRKRKKIYRDQESEENEDADLLQIKKKIRGMQKHEGITERAFSYRKKTQNEEKNRDDEDTESPPTKKNKTPMDILDTKTSEREKKESDSNSTAKPAKKKYRRHRRLKVKVKSPHDVPKRRKVRHVVHVSPTTPTHPSPHMCTKDTPQNKHQLCTQLFSALVGVEDVTEELVSGGVTRTGIHQLQEKARVLGEVLEKIEADESFFLTMDQQLFVSYLHRLDQVSLCFHL